MEKEKNPRPYKNAEEFKDAFLEHNGSALITKNGNSVVYINCFDDKGIGYFADKYYEESYENLLDLYTWLDGTICGKDYRYALYEDHNYINIYAEQGVLSEAKKLLRELNPQEIELCGNSEFYLRVTGSDPLLGNKIRELLHDWEEC